MCVDPITALMIGSTALSAGGSLMSGIENSRVARIQASMAEQKAKTELAQGAYREQETRRQIDAVLGGQQAYFAANGLDPAQGSPVALAASSAGRGEVDALLQRYSAVRDATTSRVEAENYRQQGRQALLSGIFGAGTALLSAGTQYYQWQALRAASPAVTGATIPIPTPRPYDPFGIS